MEHISVLTLFLSHKNEVVEQTNTWAVTQLICRKDLTVKCVPSVLLGIRKNDFHTWSSTS